MTEIVISGMGIVSALGNNVEENLQALLEKRTGIAPLRYLKTSHTEFPVGEVKMTNEEMLALLDISEDVPTVRTALMGILALREALQNAGICDERWKGEVGRWKLKDGPRIALISGTTVGGMDKSEQYYLDFLENDLRNEYISTHDCGTCTEMLADYFGIFSQLDTISTACSSAANAIILGAEFLKSGRADIVVAGGSECITKFHLNGFNTLMILDKEPCRPFDASRAGLNLGEGAAFVVMESKENFDKRKQVNTFLTVLCKLSGYANTCDAYHQTASSPDGEGAYLAMKQALEDAGLQPQDIDYINAHGTGTPNNDVSEGTAIMRVFGNKPPPVSSTKSFTGHTTSAAGCVESVISILALQYNFIPINLNFAEKMPEISFSPYREMEEITPSQISNSKSQVSHHTSHISINHILKNSFGFGGNDTCLIFSKTDDT
ncbi:MAG: beta-ketoacyl-[acyl-carrier-protein] synthase family protein [Bacteroidales bacterium]|jgi:3-oxoacyl-[acyl-carrier-protein] synthase-1|nr:beta-ketoacyl-[acyl-carrier-protein] synthase family protein [Bacteroidales bacterium]